MNKFIFIFFVSFIFHSFGVIAQDSISSQKEKGYVFRIIPSTLKNFYGISIGLIGSEVICNVNHPRNSHGINLQLVGQGLFIPLNPRAFSFSSALSHDTCWLVINAQNKTYKAKHNGLLISGFGTMTDYSNGIVISGLSSMGFEMNGISINILSSKYVEINGIAISLFNQAHTVNGIQFGLINKSNKVNGLQIGLWNVNQKRKLPLINW